MSDPESDPRRDEALDRQLRAAFEPPPSEHFQVLAAAVASPALPSWPWRTLLAAAAVLLLALGFWLWPGQRDHHAPLADAAPPAAGPFDGKALGALWVAAHDDAAQRGGDFGGCCDAGCDLASLCREICGQALSHEGSDAVRLLGRYHGVATGGCAAFLLRADDVPVCVFVLPRAADPGVQLPPDRQLAVGRRELGELVLYSVSRPLEVDALAGFALP